MTRPTVLFVGGLGRSEDLYRACAESLGFDLLYAERKLPPTPPRVARIIVVASVCSHPLREAAASLARQRHVPIEYLRSPSISALRRALDESKQEAAHAAR